MLTNCCSDLLQLVGMQMRLLVLSSNGLHTASLLLQLHNCPALCVMPSVPATACCTVLHCQL
jgi:hypothetical protein